jgi:hypothetical protein
VRAIEPSAHVGARRGQASGLVGAVEAGGRVRDPDERLRDHHRDARLDRSPVGRCAVRASLVEIVGDVADQVVDVGADVRPLRGVAQQAGRAAQLVASLLCVTAQAGELRLGQRQVDQGVRPGDPGGGPLSGGDRGFSGALVAGQLEQHGLLRPQLDDVLDRADALRAAGAAWANDVGATTSRLAGYSTLNGVRSDDYWTGMAADAYRNTLIPQNTALTSIKTVGDEIDATLNDLASAVTTFWVAVLGALGAFEVAVLAAAASAATVIGAPVAAGIIIAAIVAFAGALFAAISAYTAIANDTSNRSAELERRLSNDTAFPAGAWPRSTTPISGDGSITDGDDTDWHLE